MTPHSTSPVSLEYSFPGRWVGGTALVLGPSLWLVGLVLRLPFHFFFPQQLQAYHEAPGRLTAAYACVLFGGIVTSLGVIALAAEIGRSRPLWATWGGVLVLLGLFTRAFHAGVDHLAFQLVPQFGPSEAAAIISRSYGAFQPVSVFVPALMGGWIVLAIGAYRSNLLPLWRAIGLGLTGGLMGGVLKGTTAWSMLWVGGLAVGCVPLGLQMLVADPRPSARSAAGWLAVVCVVLVLCFVVGQLG